MESSGNTWESQGGKVKPRTFKNQHEDFDSSDRVDSGFGDSLPSMPSDRSDTNSYSIDDISRDQKCVDSTDCILQKTKNLKISEPKICKSIDDGYASILSERSVELPSLPSTNKGQAMDHPFQHQYVSVYDCMRCFAQTQDFRYVLAPFWPTLLHRNDEGDTSLHLAIINCNEQAIQQIIDVLPRPEYFDVYNNITQTPLHLAAITRQHKIVGKLIDRGASVDLVDRNGQTCVHLACHRGDLKTLAEIFKPRSGRRELHEKLQEILETRNFDGLTPLCVAVKARHIEIVKELITLGADANAADSKSGNTALHLAVEDNNLVMVSCLLFKGNADPNAMSYSSNTPLHIAAGLGLDTIVATLIAMGASGSIENLEGDTAFRIASESDEDLFDKDVPDQDVLDEDCSDHDVDHEEMEN
ncbi:nuclear factor NF-kappa-B p105 subunit isoform X1 [Paramuricea clavata]|uniref:Nuclear factor NF-kappa-B p105 subunit isoform X1 n=1 Tax=Paramuricea clavata TaxID=317549 RepID=A0A6S7GMZ9_PARCT|nr:nuclear factor NF-kappa-B p105 subunit isoform X1 [Paramuricea clavata]